MKTQLLAGLVLHGAFECCFYCKMEAWKGNWFKGSHRRSFVFSCWSENWKALELSLQNERCNVWASCKRPWSFMARLSNARFNRWRLHSPKGITFISLSHTAYSRFSFTFSFVFASFSVIFSTTTRVAFVRAASARVSSENGCALTVFTRTRVTRSRFAWPEIPTWRSTKWPPGSQTLDEEFEKSECALGPREGFTKFDCGSQPKKNVSFPARAHFFALIASWSIISKSSHL